MFFAADDSLGCALCLGCVFQHLAAGGFDDLVRFLIVMGADVNGTDHFGTTPLLEALRGGTRARPGLLSPRTGPSTSRCSRLACGVLKHFSGSGWLWRTGTPSLKVSGPVVWSVSGSQLGAQGQPKSRQRSTPFTKGLLQW